MKAMIPAERFKIHGAQPAIQAGAAVAEEVTLAEAIPVVGGTPVEEATLGVVIPEVAVTDLMDKTATADGTQRLTRGWRT
jgi:hypothetical protein